jgi:uncharacterized protein YjdB
MQGYGGLLTSSATLTVTAGTSPTEPIVALTIVPGSQSVALPTETGQFIALGTTGGTGVQVNLTDKVTWGSSNLSVATINTAGLATAAGQGSTTITAIAKNPDGSVVPATATFTVTGVATEPLLSLAILPATQTVALPGQSSQLIAIGTFSSTASTPGTQDLTATVTWKSSNSSVATVTSPGGLVTAVGQGTAAITAIATNPDKSVVTATATFTVSGAATEPLLSLSILPSSQSVAAVGQSSTFISIGTFSASSSTPGTQNMANISSYTVTWSSSNQSVATIGPTTGVATAQGVGTTAITAIATNNTDKSVVTSTATFTVLGPSTQEVTSLTIVPAAQSVTLPVAGSPYQTAKFVAIGTNSTTGLQQILTDSVAWDSSNPQVANINTLGVATGIGAGSSTITAVYQNPDLSKVTATAVLTVTGSVLEPLQSVQILPSTQSVASPGQTSQLAAIGTFSTTPTTQDVTKGLASPAITTKWTSSSTSVATVGSPELAGTTPGLVTAVSQGTVAIVAVSTNPDGTLVTSTATFTVVGGSSEQITALQIVPSSQAATAAAQQSQFFVLGTQGTSGLQYDLTSQVVWASSNKAVATICTAGVPASCAPANSVPGLATAVGTGVTTISATWTNLDGSKVTASATYSVTIGAAQEPLLSINIIPSAISVGQILDTGQFLAFGNFSTTPTIQDLTDQVSWISTTPQIVTIETSGVPGADAGLATALGEGPAVIVAEMANPDKTVVTATATFTCPIGQCSAPVAGELSTLTVYNAGQNSKNWLVTAPSNTAVPPYTKADQLIHCGPYSATDGYGNSVCVATYPVGTTVTLTVANPQDLTFGGWSSNCNVTSTYTCQVTLTTDDTVGAIFN